MVASTERVLSPQRVVDRGADWVSDGYRAYVLGMLVLVGTIGWVDRTVFSILLESIKKQFSFSDTQLGLLGGVAFGLFYATLGLPIAWLADRSNRRSIIVAAVALWSAMTALCGLATGFASLFFARLGVGVGEAGGTPPSHSLISDYFPPGRRAFALGILYLYIPLGFVVGFLSGGWLNQFFGWRTAFVVLGLPGIAVAVVLLLTLREPRRGNSERRVDVGAAPRFWSTIGYFLSRSSLRHIPLGGAVQGIGAFATAVWLPAYFMRTHGLNSGEAGNWMAVAYGLGGGVGVLAGGYLADLLVRRTGDQRWYAWEATLASALSAPLFVLLFFTRSSGTALIALVGAMMFAHMHLGAITSMMQSLASLRRRALVVAFYLFFVNLISMGVGPVLAGAISDALTVRFGSDALRYALLAIVPVANLWAAFHFLMVSRSFRQDKAFVESQPAD